MTLQPTNKLKDDYDWVNEYPNYHSIQTRQIEQTESFSLGEFKIDNGKIIPADKPLHPNQQLLYGKMLEWNPASVFEVGFGYGNHLASIKRVCPNVQLNGCDISNRQYLAAYERNIEIFDDDTWLFGDFLELEISRTFDVVYSNAVLMHMSTERQKAAIAKMLALAVKYVLIIDGAIQIPDFDGFCTELGYKPLLLNEWAEENWSNNYYLPPIIFKK